MPLTCVLAVLAPSLLASTILFSSADISLTKSAPVSARATNYSKGCIAKQPLLDSNTEDWQRINHIHIINCSFIPLQHCMSQEYTFLGCSLWAWGCIIETTIVGTICSCQICVNKLQPGCVPTRNSGCGKIRSVEFLLHAKC